ncbi:MAG: DUF3426 domain-containing protein [Burkholderiales bacterium]|jgi:predicted Zn finger-like uncharacterized protein|nr:DUF3426 domain-containing protein [Burkholderiales bacterium]
MAIHFTRCPQCRTTFRITSPQLALREGQARCGHCRAVFNAFAMLVDFKGERVPGPGMAPMQRETMTLRDSVSAPDSDFTVIPPKSELPAASVQQTIAPPAPEIEAVDSSLRPLAHEKSALSLLEKDFSEAVNGERADEGARQQKKRLKPSPLSLVLDPAKKPTVWQRLRLPPWCRPLFYLVSLPGLLLLLAAQATFFLHDELANAYPKLTPALSQGCHWLGCEIKPLQNLGALVIEATDMQSDAVDAQQLLLTVTLRNRSDRPVAYPSLSLELTDEQGKLLVRRFFAPEAYLDRAADASTGAPAARDLVLRLLLRSEVAASGYRLSLVYS